MVAAVDLGAKLGDLLAATLLDILSCIGLLFINLDMLLAIDIRGEGLLDVVDALARKIRLLGTGRPHHHVDVRVGFLVMIGGNPTKI